MSGEGEGEGEGEGVGDAASLAPERVRAPADGERQPIVQLRRLVVAK